MQADAKYMKIALAQARAAFARGEFPVGCVLVVSDQVIAGGRRSGTTGGRKNETDHAEMRALRRMVKMDPMDLRPPVSLFTTLEPCLMCYSAAILNGVHRIVYAYEDVMGGGTRCDLTQLPPLYREADITVAPHVMRAESLQLFKAYFSDPATEYWRDSLLARYTLTQ
jgi:tRNA(adenine34) deaminase